MLLPLNTAYTLAELEYFLGDAEPALTLCRPDRLEPVRALAQKLDLRSVESLGVKRDGTFAEAIAAAPPEFETAPRASDDLAAILYTSGTTGRSKGAMLTHENLSSNALTLIDCWRFGPADRLIHALPVFHTHGLFVAVNVALLSGATMIFMPRFDPEAVIAALPEATAMMGVPTFYTRLLDHPGLDREACANMRLFVSGSAPLLAETHAAWRERTGFAILERYGMTETNMITSNPYDGERRPGTVGFALPGVSVRIADLESGAPVQAGEIGVIEVKGPNVFAGYWRMPEKTAQEFRADGYFITGDLAHVDERWLHPHRRAGEGSGDFRRLQCLSQGGRDRDRRDRGRARERCVRRPACRFRRSRDGGRRRASGRGAERSGDPLGARRPPGQVQGAQTDHLRRFAAAQCDGQGAEGGAAGSLQGHLSRRCQNGDGGEAHCVGRSVIRYAARCIHTGGLVFSESLRARRNDIWFDSMQLGLSELPRGVRKDRVDLAGVGQEIGPPLRAVAVVVTDLRQQPLELLHVARCRVAELRVGAKAAPKLVERLLAGLRVEAARHSARIAAAPSIPHLDRSLVVDEAGDFPAQRLERLRAFGRGLVRLVAGGGRKQVREPSGLSAVARRRWRRRRRRRSRPRSRRRTRPATAESEAARRVGLGSDAPIRPADGLSVGGAPTASATRASEDSLRDGASTSRDLLGRSRQRLLKTRAAVVAAARACGSATS